MDSERVLVTGGAGFIGRWIVQRLLDAGHEVWAFDNLSSGRAENLAAFRAHPRFRGLLTGDVRDRSAVAAAFGQRPGLCIHAAAEIEVQKSLEDPARHFEVNVQGTYHVLEEARRRDTKIVLVGTCMVYDTSTGTPIAETHPTRPASPYAGSKLAGEDLAYAWWRSYGLPAVLLRPFNTYGPFQKSNQEGGVVAIFVRRHLDGQDLLVYGDGTQTRDLLYVEDCADFVVRAAAHPRAVGEVFNAGWGQDIPIRDLALRVAGDPRRIKLVPHHHLQSEIAKLVCDRRKARDVLGWEPKVDLEEGLRRLTVWMRASGGA